MPLVLYYFVYDDHIQKPKIRIHVVATITTLPPPLAAAPAAAAAAAAPQENHRKKQPCCQSPVPSSQTPALPILLTLILYHVIPSSLFVLFPKSPEHSIIFNFSNSSPAQSPFLLVP